MIVYSVTVSVDPDIEDDWVEWMLATHIPDVMATGCFEEYRLQRLLTETEPDTRTYNVQYLLETMDDYFDYQNEHAKRLQAETAARYSGRYAAFRTLLEILESGNRQGEHMPGHYLT